MRQFLLESKTKKKQKINVITKKEINSITSDPK